MNKKSSGITLIALSITIIVLLILAGVSIATLTSDNGIIQNANKAKKETEKSQWVERIDIAILYAEKNNLNPTLNDVIEELEKADIIEDSSQVDLDTGTITTKEPTYEIEGKLDDYMVEEVIPETNSKYFNFSFSSDEKTASITGIKDEYKFNGAIKDGDAIITEIGIPKTVKDGNNVEYNVNFIDLYAFRGCTSLTKVGIPDSVTVIGEGAFRGCTSLARVSIPNSVTAIGLYAFYECTSLTKVSIPNSVTVIGNYAFYGCTSLARVSIPNSVTVIGVFVFYGCASLTKVSIPNSVTAIGKCAFDGCTNLKTVNIDNVPEKVSIGVSAFPDGTEIKWNS